MRQLAGKNVVFFISELQFHDQEYLIPKNILEKAGIKVFTSSLTNNLAFGQYGLKIKPEMILANLHSENFLSIVLVGGKGIKSLWNEKLLHKIIREFYQQKKPIAAICSAVGILANAGLLKGKKVAFYKEDKEIIESSGAILSENDCEADDLFVTASGPESAKAFSQLLLERLSLEKSL